MLNIVGNAITFDDVLLVPAYSSVLPKDVNLRSKLTRKIRLNLPIVSAAMDCVTESSLAISVAQEGGIGIIHKNMSVIDQVSEVKKVKSFSNSVISHFVTVDYKTTVRKSLEIFKKYNLSRIPVLKNGTLIGVLKASDVFTAKKLDNLVSDVMMLHAEKFITLKNRYKRADIELLFHDKELKNILITDDKGNLLGLINNYDFQKTIIQSNASIDYKGQLMVGAAVGIGSDIEERASQLIEAGVDVIVVDTAHGYSMKSLNCIKWLREEFSDIQIIGGNVVTAEAALALVKLGVDGIKVGIGPGSICTTRIVSGVGVPQLTAISDVAEALQHTDVPVIADGGTRHSGDLCKAIAAGASSVMIGSLFASTKEAPGQIEVLNGKHHKFYRGMGSLGAMKNGSSDRYFQNDCDYSKLVPEGVEGYVPYSGTVCTLLHQLTGGMRAGMSYTGSLNIKQMQNDATFVRISNASFSESHIHDVVFSRESPNYRLK